VASLSVRIGVYLASISVIGVGVGLMVEGDLGVAPNDVLNTGLSDTFGFGVGTAAWITGVVAMIVAWMLGRRPRIATVLGSVIVGLSINGALAVMPTPDTMGVRMAFLAGGLVLIWVGITGVVASDVGAGPLELVMLAFMDRGLGIRWSRWGLELTLLLLGLALGGAAGVGTLLFAFGTGPVLAITLPPAAARMGVDLTHPTDVAAVGP
jgi:uncharacterized membrane protein YczE